MYAKKEGDRFWLYFDTVEEARAVYREEEKGFWEYRDTYLGWESVNIGLEFYDNVDRYRRQLTDEYEVREGFDVGDPVCWCGANGEVEEVRGNLVVVSFEPAGARFSFLPDGRYLPSHKIPSLFHGHDVLRAEDQRFPAVEELPSVQVGKCIPHELDNLKAAIEGRWENVSVGLIDCYLCNKYYLRECSGCPIAKDSGERCSGTPYQRIVDGCGPVKDVSAYRDMVVYLLNLQRRLEKEEAAATKCQFSPTNSTAQGGN